MPLPANNAFRTGSPMSGPDAGLINRCASAAAYADNCLGSAQRGEQRMKLAEGLALRADAARRVEQLRARIVASARYQEGEEPPEDAAALLAEGGVALGVLEGLVGRGHPRSGEARGGAAVSFGRN